MAVVLEVERRHIAMMEEYISTVDASEVESRRTSASHNISRTHNAIPTFASIQYP
jgi:hypothetical protein